MNSVVILSVAMSSLRHFFAQPTDLLLPREGNIIEKRNNLQLGIVAFFIRGWADGFGVLVEKLKI